MDKFEQRADSLLRAIERKEQVRIAQLRSERIKTLENFHVGDPITLSLTGITIDGIPLESDGIISGAIVDPDRALIDVRHNTTEIPDIEGRRIGLAVDIIETTPTEEEMFITHRHSVAGNQGVAYYLAEDLAKEASGELYVPDDKILHPALKYGRVAVLGTRLFDFITAVDQL